MSVVVLEPLAEPAVPLEAPGIRPNALAALGEAEIARLPVWHGKEKASLGDFFRVSGGRSDDVRIAGDAGRIKHLGSGMAGGRLVIEGNAGAHVGAEMTGGRIIVEGDAGPWAGAELRGGVLEIRGNAGSHLAAAYAGSPRGMTGGLVLVHGSAGDLVGERMRRGVVAVAGDVGDYAGAAMLAGTLLVFGRLGRRPGAGLRRGTILAGSEVDLLPTFRYACTYRPTFLRVYLRRLREEYGLSVDPRFVDGAYRRYNGDFADLGRGELLTWTTP